MPAGKVKLCLELRLANQKWQLDWLNIRIKISTCSVSTFTYLLSILICTPLPSYLLTTMVESFQQICTLLSCILHQCFHRFEIAFYFCIRRQTFRPPNSEKIHLDWFLMLERFKREINYQLCPIINCVWNQHGVFWTFWPALWQIKSLFMCRRIFPCPICMSSWNVKNAFHLDWIVSDISNPNMLI